MKLAAVLVAICLASAGLYAAQDMTLGKSPQPYIPTYRDLAYNTASAGDAAVADVKVVGTALQYTGVVLNGNGIDTNSSFPFLKVQEQDGAGTFDHAACYIGNNGAGGTFGLGFFALTQTFSTAHMAATRNGSSVTIEFTNIDGGTKANQTYTCDGAPADSDTFIGVTGYTDQTAQIDNFGNDVLVLDTFSFTGTLASSGNWADVAPGMNAVNGYAQGGFEAISYFTGPVTGSAPTLATITRRFMLVGKTVTVTLTGTNFIPNQTAINAGTGINVSNVIVTSPTQMTATFAVPSGTPLGRHNISVTTPFGTSNTVRFLVL